MMIQEAQSWTGLIGIIDIYCFRAPSENFSGGPESLAAPPAPALLEGNLSFWHTASSSGVKVNGLYGE